jgi:hypothetical protein
MSENNFSENYIGEANYVINLVDLLDLGIKE